MAMDIRARCAIEVPDNEYNTIGLELGYREWRHPEIKGYSFGSEAYAKQYAIQHNVDPEQVYEDDSRMLLKDVLKAIQEKEGEIWGEYINLELGYGDEARRRAKTEKWPEKYRWISVYVVTGGSEGYYLHVDILTDGIGDDQEYAGSRKMIILGKSLGYGWHDCWLSAARIAAMLGA